MTLLKAVLFDLDGTLLDTAPDFVLTVNQLLSRHGLAELPAEDIRNTVSQGARALVTLAFKLQEGDDGFDALLEQLLDQYEKNLGLKSELFPGIRELLEKLSQHNIAWGIATNKPARFTQPLMARTQLPSLPASTICPDDVEQRKPHPESLHIACKEIGCDLNEAIYIGDHLRDIQCGQNAGMDTIAAAYGYIIDGDKPENWRATHLVSHASELWPIINTRIQINGI
jgi:phosphoglycolate phosphatase